MVRQIAMADLDSLFPRFGKGAPFGQYRDELRARTLDKWISNCRVFKLGIRLSGPVS